MESTISRFFKYKNEVVEPVIPANEKGKSLDLHHSVTKENVTEADKFYELACWRLQRPWLWHELSGKLTAEFKVPDLSGGSDQHPVAVDDYIQINLPAPGNDWVRVKSIEEDFKKDSDKSFAITLIVAEDPGDNSNDVNHFFSEGATSTFIISRKDKVVTASYHGRNETPNTEASNIGEVVRNVVVAMGAIAGLSELQWMALLKGLMNDG